MIKLIIAGDSTAAHKLENKRPETGWGEKIKNFLTPYIKVNNFAQNGKSTKSFQDEGIYDEMLKQVTKGDLVLIQFGHNDSKEDNLLRYASPKAYQENLAKFCLDIKKKNATPMILSSITRRIFKNNRIDPYAVGIYPALAEELAKKESIMFLDVFREVASIYESFGEEGSKRLFLQLKPNEYPNYPDGIIDQTHLNDFGASVVAAKISELLLKTSFKEYIVESEVEKFYSQVVKK